MRVEQGVSPAELLTSKFFKTFTNLLAAYMTGSLSQRRKAGLKVIL